MARILLVEDDLCIRRSLQSDLLLDLHSVDVAEDGEQGWALLQQFRYDLTILDVMLPLMDGLELCRRLRARQLDTPVLLLTSLGDTADKVRGLDAGADDYLAKPFALIELRARIRALTRRQRGECMVLRWNQLEIEPVSKRVRAAGQEICLTAREYQILELFLRYPGHVLSSSQILERVWGWEAPGPGSVKTHLRSLRQKLRSAGVDNLIDTLYGQGYRLKDPAR